MAKKRKAATKKKAPKRKAMSKGIFERVVDAVTPTTRNARGGNVTRRQGI